MNRTGNTIPITGIGRGLAEAFHRDGNQVIIAGRRQSVWKIPFAPIPVCAVSWLTLKTSTM
jgi:uncharacterized oxidoreductase